LKHWKKQHQLNSYSLKRESEKGEIVYVLLVLYISLFSLSQSTCKKTEGEEEPNLRIIYFCVDYQDMCIAWGHFANSH
jgi:hypothetical protein